MRVQISDVQSAIFLPVPCTFMKVTTSRLRTAPHAFSPVLKPIPPASRRVFIALAIGISLALPVSTGSWLGLTGPEAPPVYLLYLPFCLGIPYVLLGAPVALISAPIARLRTYSWGAVALALVLSGTWCLFAVIDPLASQAVTQTVLLYGWMVGGTVYQVLLLLLVANA